MLENLGKKNSISGIGYTAYRVNTSFLYIGNIGRSEKSRLPNDLNNFRKWKTICRKLTKGSNDWEMNES